MHKTNTSHYITLLNPHAKYLHDECIIAMKNKMWASVLILTLTILDNINADENSLNYIDALDLNDLRNSKDFHWLRQRRNKILHFEGPIEGFYGNNDSEYTLKKDAERSLKIMRVGLTKLFQIYLKSS